MVSLFNEDCINVMRQLYTGMADLVVTDPPYGMDFQSNRSKSGPRHNKIENDSVLFFDWLPEAFRLLKVGGGLITFCNWATSHLWYDALVKNGFTVKSQVIWDREHHGMGDLKGAFAPQHDVIWYASKGRRVFCNGRPKSVIRERRPSPSEDFGHPTCKPVALMKKLIYSVQDGSSGTVIDPFMGSGSTGVACKELNLPFIGIELKKEYFDVAASRLGV